VPPTKFRRYAILGPVFGAWASQLVAIGLIVAAAPAPFTDSGQAHLGLAFYSGIAGLVFLALGLAAGIQLPLSRREVVAVLSVVFPTVLTAMLGALVLMPSS